MASRWLVGGWLGCAVMAAVAMEPRDGDDPRWQAWAAHERLTAASLTQGLHWKPIGPIVQGGRVVDVESVPGDPYGFYVAYATGGVWKTTNNGVSFEPLSDTLPTTVTGDIAVDPHRPERLWLGSGEPNSSRSSYGGMGLFRSDDGGKTFVHLGLTDVDRISRIVVHPNDGTRVCVAAIGSLYGEGGRRGVFCTRDDGATWQQVLKGEGHVGVIDLAFDPANPDTLYAATWERTRKAWDFVESGAGSGIWKSVDGGATWVRLAGGFPQGATVGRIGLALSPSRPGTLYASVDNWAPLPEDHQDLGDRPITARRLKSMSKAEFLAQDPDEIETFIRDSDLDTELDAKRLIAKVKSDEITIAQLIDALHDANGALFDSDAHGLEVWRSDDAGATWRKTHEDVLDGVTYTYGYYFGQIRVSPSDVDRIYLLGVPVITSADGGKTFSGIAPPQMHGDHHAWWIDPARPQHLIAGNDGGVDVSYDGGKTWLKLDAQPVGQFYTVAVDMAEPFNVYGGLQDNGTWKGSSEADWRDADAWSFIGGGDGMHVAVDPRDATAYTGYQFGFYQSSAGHEVRPRAAFGTPPLRYNWNTPVVLSPHQPDVVYFGANRLFRSLDGGKRFEPISPDLTRSEHPGDVPYATLTSISESPKQFGLIWAGTDDGMVWVSQGAGHDWQDVSASLPDRWVSRVVASRHVRDRAYVSFNTYRDDEAVPLVFVSENLGQSWTSIAANLPGEAVNAIVEDPVNADVLYVATDRGVYVTFDRGGAWQTLGADLPHVPVHDLVVHPRDRRLVAATHGRSVWVLDALPVQDLTADVRAKSAHVFYLDDIQGDRNWRSQPSRWYDETDSLPKQTVTFWAKSAGPATLTVRDADHQAVREWSVRANAGINTVTWDLLADRDLALAAERRRNAKAGKPDDEGARARTPYAESVRLGHRLFLTPGEYTMALRIAGSTAETAFTIKAPEPRKSRAVVAPAIRGKKTED